MTPDWFALVPRHIAQQQLDWERAQRVVRMREAGMSYAEIARREGVGAARLRHIAHCADRPAPVHRWLLRSGDIAVLAEGGFRGWTGRGLC